MHLILLPAAATDLATSRGSQRHPHPGRRVASQAVKMPHSSFTWCGNVVVINSEVQGGVAVSVKAEQTHSMNATLVEL